MTALRDAATEEVRNRQLILAMADVDAFYVPYRDSLLRHDNSFNASIDLLALLSDVAGRAATAVAAKDNYLSFGALLTGSRSAVNNRFFYAQTGIALIKGMDAARAERALAIKARQGKAIGEYTGRDAFADVLQYYFDGTMAGGILWLQATASQNETEDRAKIANLPIPTQADYDLRKSLTSEISTRLSNESALRRALSVWKIADPGLGIEAARGAFLSHYRKLLDNGANPSEIRTQLTEANFFKDPS